MKDYIPAVEKAATQNLALINRDLKPLFAWLEGPHGMGIFRNLEALFYHDLPYAMGAFDNGTELFLRVVDLAAQHTGGFIHSLDDLLTRWNSMSNAQLGSWVDRYVNDFRLWDRFVKLLIEDIYLLFKNDAGTGNAIVKDLSQMRAPA